MKKIISILLVFTMVFAFGACGKKDTNIGNYYDGSTEFALGETSGNTYQNSFIGLGCRLDSGWTFYSDEQIKELNNLAVDMAGDEIKEALSEATVIYDMYATDENQFNNININLEKVDAAQLASFDFVENFRLTAPTIKQAFENMGYENVSYEIITIEVDGKTLDALHTTAEIQGMNMYQTIFQKKCNGYVASIAVTTYYDNTTPQLLENFFWLE